MHSGSSAFERAAIVKLLDLLIVCSLASAATSAVPVLAQEALPPFAGEILAGDAMPGSFYVAPPGEGPFPAIVLIGGSEGGDGSARRTAPRFVAEGYAVLGLVYYSPAWFGRDAQFPELPAAFDAIPVERAGQAREFLCHRAEVRCDDVGIYGVSKGAEFALLAGSLIDGFAAIAAIVPSDVVWEGWGPGTAPGRNSSFSWQGEPLSFVPYLGMQEQFAKYSTGERPRLRLPHDAGRHANPERAVQARIKVEDIDEPVLVAGGDADNVWNSGEMAQAISERRTLAGLQTTALIFTDADHGLSGDGSNEEGWYDQIELEAQRKVWPATLQFFADNLKD